MASWPISLETTNHLPLFQQHKSLDYMDILRQIDPGLQAPHLIDTWRLHNTSSKDFSFYSTPHQTHQRLDYVFSSVTMAQHVAKSEIGNIRISDHAPITNTFLMADLTLRQWSWRLNESLLDKPETKDKFSKELASFFNINDTHELPPEAQTEILAPVTPKEGKDPRQCSSYRPISLLNVALKIWSKILALRLLPCLPLLLNEEQESFMTGREGVGKISTCRKWIIAPTETHKPPYLLAWEKELELTLEEDDTKFILCISHAFSTRAWILFNILNLDFLSSLDTSYVGFSLDKVKWKPKWKKTVQKMEDLCLLRPVLGLHVIQLYDSVFGFCNQATMVSYKAKKEKSVILLSTMHHDGSIDTNNRRLKPEIILHYNKTKGGVDKMDEMIGDETHPEFHANRKDKKRLYLTELCYELLMPTMMERSSTKCLPRQTTEAMIRCGICFQEHPEPRDKKRKRCYICPAKKDWKSERISYGATDPSLSDRLLYPHVFRTVQNSHIHNMVVTELLEHFGWTWVGIFVSDDDAGENELQILRKYMRERGICVAYTIKYTEEDIEYNDQILQVLHNPQVRVIILCGTFTHILTHMIQDPAFVVLDKTFILPPSLAFSSLSTVNWFPEFNRSLVVEFSSQSFQGMEDFVKNYRKLPSIFNEEMFWRELDSMTKYEKKDSFISLTHEEYNSTDILTLPSIRYFLMSGISPRLYEAVEVLAKALHEMFLYIKDKSPENPITGLIQYTQKLQRHLQRMKSPLDPMRPSYYFNERGEAVHGYKIIYRVYIEEATYKDVREDIVGNITPWAVSGQKLYINTSSIPWRHTQEIPVSRCSEPCLPGSRKKARETIHTCCYDCMPCSEGEISNITDADNCMKCQSNEWSNEKRDRCLPKLMEFISYHNDTIASVSSFVSVIGCLVTSSIFGIFISYRDTPIVKANNRNLSYLLLVSIILSFLSVFLFLGRPSDVTCRLCETSFGVFFSVAVSSLLAKTVMVCVAFKSTKPGSPWRKWLSVKLPYTIVLLCSSFQVVICVLWLSISPPFQDLDTQSYPEKIIIQCNEGSDLWFYSMLGYMGLLATVSFLLAFMVRTLPDSFNEAKYITFSMLLFCSVWMSMIPAYLSTRGKYMVAVEIFAVMASSAGLLASCVFFPKCFIILFRSEMNRKTDLLGRRKD
ncbi:vomeronasal type-2 receptor 26-like [Leptodactylus fuscus]